MSRIAVLQALEACECGDYGLCIDILLTLLDELDEGPVVYRVRCSDCGERFAWPGDLEGHRSQGCPVVVARELWEQVELYAEAELYEGVA